jgi:hypothetical protein
MLPQRYAHLLSVGLRLQLFHGYRDETHVKPSAATPSRIKSTEQNSMTTWRTDFTSFILDLLDFMEGKIAEALATEDSRRAAISEAADAIPVLRERVRENDTVNAHFVLALRNMFEESYASDEWEAFAKLDRTEFERTARDLVGPEGRFADLRKIVADADAP